MENQKEATTYNVVEGGILLIPSDAIKIHEKLDNCSDCSSVYSEDARLAVDEEKDSLSQSKQEIQKRLYKFGLDSSGLPIRDDLLFSSYEEAAAFSDCREELSIWKRLAGFKPRQVEVPHVVLWDYFGGHSCLDVNVTSGDVVHVVAEEYQVRKLRNDAVRGRSFLRLPNKWSLVRCMTGRPFQGDAGLIPSSWIVPKDFFDANPSLFVSPKWYLGICCLSVAYRYLVNEKSKIRCGNFVIFSPRWLNLDPKDYRPYFMFVVCPKNKKIVKEMASIAAEHEAGRTRSIVHGADDMVVVKKANNTELSKRSLRGGDDDVIRIPM